MITLLLAITMAAEEGPNLKAIMKELGQNFHFVSQAIEAPTEETLQRVRDMQELVAQARTRTPRCLEVKEGVEREIGQATFKKIQGELNVSLAELELALLQDEGVVEAFEVVKATRSKGHKAFKRTCRF